MSSDPLTASAATIDELSTQEGYDRWAEYYDDDDNPLIAIEGPCVHKLLGDVRGMTALDVGCGTGRHAMQLADAGAHVTAIDFSEGMLRQARSKLPGGNIRFQAHDLGRPFPFSDQTFDCVICGLVIDHIANLTGLFGEMNRVCKPNGHIVASVLHPAMMLRGVTARFREPGTGREIRPASCSHQISDYVMAATNAGLKILNLSEHRVDAALAASCKRAEKYFDWPLLFLMQLAPGKTQT